MEKSSLIILTVLMLLSPLWAAGPVPEPSPAFYEYGRLYLPEPSINDMAAFINQYLEADGLQMKERRRDKSLVIRITFFKNAHRGPLASGDLAAWLPMLNVDLPSWFPKLTGGKMAYVQFRPGSGWYSPLEDIQYMMVIETNRPRLHRRMALKRYVKDILDPKQLTLRGRISGVKIEFTVPEGGRLAPGSHARIHFAHSDMLDPRKSSIGMFLNSHGLKTVQLNASNSNGGQLYHAIPPSRTRDYNDLTITAGQLLEVECTPPYDPGLWTSILENSYIFLSYRLPPIRPDLARFPYPLFDPLMPVTDHITFLAPNGTGNAIMSDFLQLSYALGQWYDWRRGDISVAGSLDQWERGPLVAALPSNHPAVRAWATGKKWRDFDSTTGRWKISAKPEQGNNPGIIKFFTYRGWPVLLLSGNDTEDIRQSFRALLQKSPAKLLNSGSAEIKKATTPENDTREFLLGKSSPRSITFKELGFSDFTLRGGNGIQQNLTIPLIMGTSVPEFEAYMELVYSYSAQNNTDMASLELQGNGISFSSVPLDERKGVTLGKERIEMPHHLMTGPFQLSFYGHFHPVIIDPCKWIPREGQWFTVFSTSRITVPRDFQLKMPELRWLRLWGFPFADNPDVPSVRIETENHGEARSAALNFAFFLGRRGGHYPLSFQYGPVSDKLDYPGNVNVVRILTGFSSQKNTVKTLKPQIIQDNLDKTYRSEPAHHLYGTRRSIGCFEEFPLPGRETVLLMIHSPEPGKLERTVKLLSRPESLDKFAGAAITADWLNGETMIKSFAPKKTETWGGISAGRKAKRFFLKNMIWIFISVPFVIFMLYILLRFTKRILQRRKPQPAPEEKNDEDMDGEKDAE